MSRRLSHLGLVLTLAVLLVAIQIFALWPNITTPLESLELSARDMFMRLRSAPQRSGQIVIVAIDDFSFNWTGYRWPWPRTYLAKIVGQLNQAGARVIGLDILLFEPDADPQGDPALAEAFTQSRGAVGVVEVFNSGQNRITEKRPIPIYLPAFTRLGVTPTIVDEDAVLRGVEAFDKHSEHVYLHWAFEMAGLYLGAPPPTNLTQAGMFFNHQNVPLINQKLLVNFGGPAGTYPTYSATSVAEGDIPAETFKDKIVLIGVTSASLQDLWSTPYSISARTPGVEVVANAVDTILTGQYLRVAPPWVNLLLTLGMAVLALLILRLREPLRVVLAMALGMLLYGLIAFFLFAYANQILALVAPNTMLFLGVILPTMEQAVSQELEKRHLRTLFGRFLSSEIIDQLVSSSNLSSLNKRTDITVLFSDIRGFTTLSEKLLPEQVVALLNPYLEAMTEIIYRNGGTVDKYEGDAIMAFYGEPVNYPDHALRAVRTAVEMHISLVELRKRWLAEKILPPEVNFQIGIGLNSGQAFVGLLGSEQRINYTVIGDNVNLSARLQDLTKTYKWPILISEATQQQVKDEFETEFVDSVVVKGKTEAVRIYKVLGRQGERVTALEI
jgi:adenylate cyclase